MISKMRILPTLEYAFILEAVSTSRRLNMVYNKARLGSAEYYAGDQNTYECSDHAGIRACCRSHQTFKEIQWAANP